MPTTLRKKMTPREIAETYGVSVAKVIGWIRRGELRALNVASTMKGRPRFAVGVDDLAAFEAARAVVPRVEPVRRQRRKLAQVTEYF